MQDEETYANMNKCMPPRVQVEIQCEWDLNIIKLHACPTTKIDSVPYNLQPGSRAQHQEYISTNRSNGFQLLLPRMPHQHDADCHQEKQPRSHDTFLNRLIQLLTCSRSHYVKAVESKLLG